MSNRLRFKISDDEDPARNGSDTSRAVLLIGFLDEENLGLGYLASALREHGHSVEVFDFGRDREEILAAAKALDPILIGFSLIFQFYIDQFGGLIRFLRDQGHDCHFTMGGHFPSLSHEHTLELVPELNSVVRFEGELTLLKLVDVLSREEDWREVEGIAFELDGEVVTTAMRPLIKDLDELPYPERGPHRQAVLGRVAAPILASRGCARTCSFCSIHMFYRAAPGKVVRTRRPEEVVREMRLLHEKRGVNLFQFQDDDFPLFGKVWRRWAAEFVAELNRNELPGRVIWKINCRADAVEPELMASMRDAGLYLVYMGLESGSEQGLKTLHKQCSVEQNLRAVEILKEVGIRFEFGFMLFDPSTTFESVRENVSFLRTIVGDGSAAAGFCRMIPYEGTPIKDELARTGRLRGDICHPDYDFLDPRVDAFYEALSHVVNITGWLHGMESLSPQLNYAWNEIAVIERLFPALPDLPEYQQKLAEITRASNDLLFCVVEDMSYVYSDGQSNTWSAEILRRRCRGFLSRLLDERNAFIYGNQEVLLKALQRDGAMEAAHA